MNKLTHSDLQFCLLRTPKAVLECLKDRPGKAYVAGGFIRSVIAREEVNDIDIFVGSKEEAKHFADQLVTGRDVKVNAKPYHESDNAFTVRGFFTTPQIIHRWTFRHPCQCIESFDFTIACAAFWWEPEHDGVPAHWESICDERFYPDLASKRLVYRAPIRNEDAGGSLLRVLKFYQRGYRMPIDSLAAVVARLCQGVRSSNGRTLEETFRDESLLTPVLTGLLREVDPAIDPKHIAHLPAEDVREPVE